MYVMNTSAFSVLALATLAYYADPRFDDTHSAPAHPGLVAELVRARLLRPCLGAYVTTPAGIEAARHAGYTALIVGDFQIRYCGQILETRASLRAPLIVGDAEYLTPTGAALMTSIIEPAALTMMLVARRPLLVGPTPRFELAA